MDTIDSFFKIIICSLILTGVFFCSCFGEGEGLIGGLHSLKNNFLLTVSMMMLKATNRRLYMFGGGWVGCYYHPKPELEAKTGRASWWWPRQLWLELSIPAVKRENCSGQLQHTYCVWHLHGKFESLYFPLHCLKTGSIVLEKRRKRNNINTTLCSEFSVFLKPFSVNCDWRIPSAMNWVTFNDACVYVCICDAQHSSVIAHWERFQENQKLFWRQCGVTVVFIHAR